MLALSLVIGPSQLDGLVKRCLATRGPPMRPACGLRAFDSECAHTSTLPTSHFCLSQPNVCHYQFRCCPAARARRVRGDWPQGVRPRTTPAEHAVCDAWCGSRTAVLTRAPPRACFVASAQTQAVSVSAALPKVAESARLALVGAAAVLVLSTVSVKPALANSCGSMPTGAWWRPAGAT